MRLKRLFGDTRGMSPEETRNQASTPQATGPLPVTVSITRIVQPERIPEATRWVQAGVNLANRYPGFLGSGWVRAHGRSVEWHMLYRFSEPVLLDAWENSDERQQWLARGRDLVVESRVEKRTGIEGWFDAPGAGAGAGAGAGSGSRGETEGAGAAGTPPASVPPRWKQAVSIWAGFFPVNLAFNLLASAIFPVWAHVPILPKVFVTTVILTPIMAYWVLPLATRILRPWLTAPRRGGR